MFDLPVLELKKISNKEISTSVGGMKCIEFRYLATSGETLGTEREPGNH